jgi:phage head maturation protease
VERKTGKLLDFKSSDEGTVEAVFSTFNVKDLDGDVTIPGAFEEGQQVLISSYGHKVWEGVPPVGKGTIHADNEKAVLRGQFFMKTQNGRDTFETVKEVGTQGEWSYGYDVLKADFGQFAGEPVQFLHALKVYEVSPVFRGAGIGTQTLSVKSIADMTEDQLIEQANAVCKALKERNLPVPSDLAEMVRTADLHEAIVNRDRGALEMIAALHGDYTEEGN